MACIVLAFFWQGWGWQGFGGNLIVPCVNSLGADSKAFTHGIGSVPWYVQLLVWCARILCISPD